MNRWPFIKVYTAGLNTLRYGNGQVSVGVKSTAKIRPASRLISAQLSKGNSNSRDKNISIPVLTTDTISNISIQPTKKQKFIVPYWPCVDCHSSNLYNVPNQDYNNKSYIILYFSPLCIYNKEMWWHNKSQTEEDHAVERKREREQKGIFHVVCVYTFFNDQLFDCIFF